MKICHILLFSLFAFNTLAGDTSAPTNSVTKKYDAAVLDKISGRWFEIVDAMSATNRPVAGRVELEFRVRPDGHVSNLRVVGTNVNDVLIAPCKKAVLDSAPFASWSKEMRQACTNDFRVLRMPFYYK